MRGRYRWFTIVVFFAFMLLHQSDKLLIGPLTTPIMETFGIDEAAMGAVVTGALIVGTIFYPLWGYLSDRYARARLLAAASAIWGATTWLGAVAPTFPTFVAARASTGIDDASYPGLYSLVSDYFGPAIRGRVYGILHLTQPLGYLIGMIMALMLHDVLGWRGVFYLTGAMGIVLAIVIFFGIREVPRGRSEPEFEGLDNIGKYQFNLRAALDLFRKPSLRLLYAQGFFGVFPWNVIALWFFRYLEVERHYDNSGVLVTMAIAVLVLASGYYVGGALGDYLFKRTPRGRLLVALFGVVTGAVLLYFTMNIPLADFWPFLVMLSLTALFIPFASANVLATVYDVTPPEVRSTATAVQNFIEGAGAALAPWIAGLIAVSSSLHDAILIICLSTWALCAFFFIFSAYVVPRDIRNLRAQMRGRAEEIAAHESV